MRRFLFSIASAGFCLGVLAVPAKPGFIRYVQPDGSEVKVRMIGDEHGHVLLSEDGMLLVDAGSRLEYARFDASGVPVASGVAVSASKPAEASVRLFQSEAQIDKWVDKVAVNKARRQAPANMDATRSVPLNFGLCTSTFPVIGEQKGLVVLVEYQDVQFRYGDYDYFNRMLNEEGFSEHGSLGSARDWFVENSGGRFLPDFDVYGPVKLPENRSYYGGNDVYGEDKHPEMMAVHALQSLDDEVDFSQYDRDGDGQIDNVFIFYAGKGEHDSGIANAVWPHSWDIASSGHIGDLVFDGVELNHYACTCEYPSGYKRPDGIGTFVHEFSHVMGLPDLYVTSSGNAFTPGTWSVLDIGPYNNDGLTPPNYSSFEKCALGWIDMLPVEEGNVLLPELTESNVAYFMPTPQPGEFFFFENRQQRGNDVFLPGHGMLVWHIDYLRSSWDDNTVNNNSAHQRVDIVEADNKKTEATRDGDTFPGKMNVREFRCDTAPKFEDWQRKPLQFDLVDITEAEDGVVSFVAISHDDCHGGNAVDGITADSDPDGKFFDILGRRVMNPVKGIYIRDGKKILK